MSLDSHRLDLDNRLVFVPLNAKIADISEADTDKHTLNLETALGETRKIIGIIYIPVRTTGTGLLYIYPNEGAETLVAGSWSAAQLCLIKDGTQRLQYQQSVANDVWRIYCFGYIVEA